MDLEDLLEGAENAQAESREDQVQAAEMGETSLDLAESAGAAHAVYDAEGGAELAAAAVEISATGEEASAAAIALEAAMAAVRPPSRGPPVASRSPSGRRGGATGARADTAGRRHGDTTTASSSHDAAQLDDPVFYEHIVQRTNDLFVKLNITTRPIQAFEELQKSASSMFVAIFETLFSVRLKNVIRKPRVVTDYITNAELVMTALSESLPIDLSFLSGEDIYRGDPIQIHHMLSIFESLWAQLYGVPMVDAGGDEARGGANAEAGGYSSSLAPELYSGSPSNARRASASGSPARGRSSTPFTSAGGDSDGGNGGVHKVRASPTKSKRRAPRTAATSLKATASRKAATTAKPAHPKRTKGKKKAKARDEDMQKPEGRSPRAAKPQRIAPRAPASLSTTGAARKPRPPARRAPSAKPRILDEEDNRQVQTKIRARKRREGHLPPTPGVETLKGATEKMQRVVTEPSSFAQVRGAADVAGLKVLAERYPSIYRSVWAKQKAISAQARHTQRKHDASVVTKRLEDDLDRYRKAYQILVKTHDAEVRKATLRAKRAASLAAQSGKLDARVERARSARLNEDLENLEQSHALRQQNKEEVLVRSLFSKTLKLEKEYLLSVEEQEAEEQAKIDKERLNRYESIERFYLDREEMLRERITKETREKTFSDQARRVALKQLENTIRGEYQAKLDRMAEKWDQHKEHEMLRNEEHLSQVFEDISAELVNSVQVATATH